MDSSAVFKTGKQQKRQSSSYFPTFKGFAAAQVSGHWLALCPENWSRWPKVTFATVLGAPHNTERTQYNVHTNVFHVGPHFAIYFAHNCTTIHTEECTCVEKASEVAKCSVCVDQQRCLRGQKEGRMPLHPEIHSTLF